MREDFHQKYGFTPHLVETFVDQKSYTVTCYRAANWIEVGRTKGRGKNDTHHDVYKTGKIIFVYPLVENFRELMGVDVSTYKPYIPYYKIPVEPTEHLDADEWAAFELGNSQLGHSTRTERLVRITTALGKHPMESYNSACGGGSAEIAGYYRFLENENKKITPENIIRGHVERTVQRAIGSRVLLCIQNEITFDFTSLSKCANLISIRNNQERAISKGLMLHSTHAFDPDRKLSLGIVYVSFVPKQKKESNDTRSEYEIPLEDKEFFHWVQHAREVEKIAEKLRDVQCIMVDDRVGDFFEYHLAMADFENIESIVRITNNRTSIFVENSQDVRGNFTGYVGDTYGKNANEKELFSLLNETEEDGQIRIRVPRQSKITKLDNKKEDGKVSREAHLSVCHCTVAIAPPEKMKNAQPITLQVAYVVEVAPPEDEEPICWRILTALPLHSFDDTIKIIEYYAKIWKIDEFNRVLKIGCKAESSTLRTAEAQMKIITVKMLIAWHITLLAQLGRELPDLPPDLLFDDKDLSSLKSFAET